MDDETQPEDAPFDPRRRKLCPDGACVGVIGDDGVCRVCGRTEDQAAAGEAATSAAAMAGDGRVEDEAGAADGGFDSNRRLCADGTCVGVVGEGGVCRVCGRRSE